MTIPRKLKAWHFWVPMLMQTALIIVVPLQSAVTYSTGRAVTLQTVPVDPYDLLRGYSQTLRYDISNPETLLNLPGGDSVFPKGYRDEDFSLYVVLQTPDETETSPPSAWIPVSVSRDRPQSLPKEQVALKGNYARWKRNITYGLERFYMPERERDALNTNISEIRESPEETFVVDIKVDNTGGSVPVSLWVGDRNYRF